VQPNNQVKILPAVTTYFAVVRYFQKVGQQTHKLQSAGMFCAGFAFGLASVGRYLSVPGLRSCAPATLTASQLASAIVKYAEAQPERMREDARQVTLEAFHDAWPCSN
jgi:Rap1a immunity proteins